MYIIDYICNIYIYIYIYIYTSVYFFALGLYNTLFLVFMHYVTRETDVISRIEKP